MSFTHEIDNGSWWAAKSENQAMRFAGAVDQLDLVAQRLRRVQIDNRDYQHTMKLYDSANTLFYVDPPYMQSARIDGGYEHELTDEQHVQLLDLVLSCKGQVILWIKAHPFGLFSALEAADESTVESSLWIWL